MFIQIPNPSTVLYSLLLLNPRTPPPIYSQRNRWLLAGTATPWVVEDRFPSEGLAPPWRMAYSSSLARTTEPFDLKASGRLAGTAYSCSPTQHVLPAGPASPSRMGLFVGPGWAAPSMPHGVLAPFLHHPAWHGITEGADYNAMNDLVLPRRVGFCLCIRVSSAIYPMARGFEHSNIASGNTC